ncbi:MAG: hypothetical protein IJW50_08015 [Clostridia bacterium]|nr:hypothetical protein [Clostridia bacterium]
MKQLNFEEHRKRIENINRAEAGNRSFFRRHRIRDYMPGQVTYNLGDYPARFSIAPTEYDELLLRDLAKNGVELLQIHEEWNDPIRHFGADKFSSHDPKGLQAFVDLCHTVGIKIIPYISTGYFQVTDPDFREDFSRTKYNLADDYFCYRKCWAGSPSWREYLLPRTFAVLDRYGFDGIYNDWGYDGAWMSRDRARAKGLDVSKISVDDMPYDPELEDLLSMVYSEVKRRGGVYKLHADRNNTAPCKDKVYDYLWIGECVGDEDSYGIGKGYEPYIVPCQHADFSDMRYPDLYYAKVIPFMQFPLLKSGRPMRGLGIEADVPHDERSGEYRFMKRVHDYVAAHPDGPHVYSLWSSIPDDVTEYPRWCRYLALYRPMVTQNSVAYIELRASDEILSELLPNVYASMFVNEETYLVLSNLTDAPYELELCAFWKDRVTDQVARCFTVPPKQILFLMRA